MNRTHRIVPTYTGDVSGACSALFELGGMVVIHDPSGCNSTYNTHDETRWYDHDSLIFITGLTERDAILGNDQKLVDDVVDAALELRPHFIALCNSPIPFISGTDFAAISRLIMRRTGIKTFYVRTNGMHDYVVGAGNALAAVAERFVQPARPRPRALNILGVTPLDFAAPGSSGSLRAFAGDAGFEVVSTWAMGSTLDELARAAEAEVNLVVSATGLAAARVLNARFGTPFVVGYPVGTFAEELARALRAAAASHTCATPALDVRRRADAQAPMPHAPSADTSGRGASCRDTSCRGASGRGALVVGEPVTMGSLAAATWLTTGMRMDVVCPLEVDPSLLGPTDLAVCGEEEVEHALGDAPLVVADPLYQPIVAKPTHLVPLPHQALSGRNGWPGMRDLMTLDVSRLLSDGTSPHNPSEHGPSRP